MATKTYSINTTNFLSPERGFFTTQTSGEGTTPNALTATQIDNTKAQGCSLIKKYYILHHYLNSAIPQSFLDVVQADMDALRAAGLKVIPRFVYPWTIGTQDATKERTIQHIGQVAPLMHANRDVIYCIEAGFVGRWGEWHSSSNNHVDNYTLDLQPSGIEIINEILDKFPGFVNIRYMKQKRQLFGTAPLSSVEAFSGTKKARLGHINDAFMAASDDWGTYGWTPAMVEENKNYLNEENNFLIQTGEPANGVTPGCTAVTSEIERMKWSAMAIDQGDAGAFYAHLESQGCFFTLKKRLGYRFEMVSATLSDSAVRGGRARLQLAIRNVGVARLMKYRPAYLVLRLSGQDTAIKLGADARYWMPGTVTEVDEYVYLPRSMAAGTYSALVWLPDPLLQNRAEYAVRFANVNTWANGYNNLGLAIAVS